MVGLLARLSRIVPLLIGLVVVAVIIYVAVSAVRGSTRAKEVLIIALTVLTAAVLAFFGIVSLYAWSEGNDAVLELALSCAAVGLVGLVATRVWHAVLVRRNPHYKDARQRATVIRRWPWER